MSSSPRDLIAWIQSTREKSQLYAESPEKVALEWSRVIDEAWDLVQQVAISHKWLDTPPRPQPEHWIHFTNPVVDMPAFSCRAVRDHLFKLETYCHVKLQELDSPSKVRLAAPLTDTQRYILEALKLLPGNEKMTGTELAKKAGYPNDSNFRRTIAHLRQLGLVDNLSPGYVLLPAGRAALDES